METGKHRLQAVVLNRTQYGEADLIVSFFTREFGKIRGMAKHGRKSQKRFGNILSGPALVELSFTNTSGRDLVRLEEGDLLRSFDGLSADVSRLAMASHALELIDAFCAPLDPSPEVLDLLLWALERMDSGLRPEETLFLFRLRMLGLAGFGPNFSSCPVCGSPPCAGEEIELNPDRGGMTHRKCAGGGFCVSLGTLKLMGLVQALALDKLDRVRVSPSAVKETGLFLMSFMHHLLGRELKTSRFMEQMARSHDRDHRPGL